MSLKGFKFSGIYAGIKENPTKLDMALIYSEVPCEIAGSFTSSQTKAAPVLLDLQKIKKGKAQAVIINSGNANACTGAPGLKNAKQMVSETAKALKISEALVFVSSTGKIGVQMPMQKIQPGIAEAVSALSEAGLEKAAQAILTTDKFSKIYSVQDQIQDKKYTLIGFAKGAGMIEPAMHATMLAYFCTDLAIPSKVLQTILDRVVEKTFNRITVDGDMSTNDTALLLANGLAGNKPLKAQSAEAKAFEARFEEVAHKLALEIVKDGEGATKVVEVFVKGSKSEKEAKKIAYSIAKSQLVKTSFFGQDPNWGRILAAVGYSGATFKPLKVDIYYDGVQVVSKGLATSSEAEKKAHEVMKAENFKVTVDLKQGKDFFQVWTSDLNYDYVKLNAEYRT